MKDDASSLSDKIDEWFVRDCKKECPDPKSHMKVVGSEELGELKRDVKEFVKKLKDEFWVNEVIIARIDKIFGSALIK